MTTSRSRRFVAVDIRSEFCPAAHRAELAKLYIQIIDGTDQLAWPPEKAMQLLEEHLKRPGIAIALFDRKVDENAQLTKLIGALFAHIVPDNDGVKAVEWRISIDDAEEYQKLGIAQELKWLGKIRLGELCRKYPLSLDKETSHTSLIIPNNAQLTVLEDKDSLSDKIRLDFIEEREFFRCAKFMSGQNVYASDGKKWTNEQALAFLQFTQKYNTPFVRIIRMENEIVGLFSGRLIPWRNGPCLTEIQCFAKLNDGSGPSFLSNDVASRMFENFFHEISGLSHYIYGRGIHEISIPAAGSAEFFERFRISSELRRSAIQIPIEVTYDGPRPRARKTEYIRDEQKL